jgi:hypothetical protein
VNRLVVVPIPTQSFSLRGVAPPVLDPDDRVWGDLRDHVI